LIFLDNLFANNPATKDATIYIFFVHLFLKSDITTNEVTASIIGLFVLIEFNKVVVIIDSATPSPFPEIIVGI